MSEDGDLRTVKVGNWETLFFSKLRNLFDRAEFCDLTLQFFDNSILKVHRVVLSACTDYFNMLEESCEMVEGTLILPEDLPANVIIPIVDFMYTGTLKFNNQLFEKLLKTSREMKLSVLSKLLEIHRPARVAKPMQRVLYRQPLPAKLVPRNFHPFSNVPEPTSDPLAITKVEKPPTSSIRVIGSDNLRTAPQIAKPRRTWDAREALPRAPVPVRNTMVPRMTYQRERLVRPMKRALQQTLEPRTPKIKAESSGIAHDPLSNSLAQDICDDNASEFQELPFKIESVRTMPLRHTQAPPTTAPIKCPFCPLLFASNYTFATHKVRVHPDELPIPVLLQPPTQSEEPKRVKKEENVLEISDDSFEGADDDFLLSLKDFDGQNVESI